MYMLYEYIFRESSLSPYFVPPLCSAQAVFCFKVVGCVPHSQYRQGLECSFTCMPQHNPDDTLEV